MSVLDTVTSNEILPLMEKLGFECYDSNPNDDSIEYDWQYVKDPRIHVTFYGNENLEFDVVVVLSNSWDGISGDNKNLSKITFINAIQNAIRNAFGYGSYEDYDKTLEKIYKKSVKIEKGKI